MNGIPNDAAGLQPAVTSSNPNHPTGVWRGSVGGALDAIEKAQVAILYLNRQEVEEARYWLTEAALHLQSLGAPGQG